jgi:hypothetical protein
MLGYWNAHSDLDWYGSVNPETEPEGWDDMIEEKEIAALDARQATAFDDLMMWGMVNTTGKTPVELAKLDIESRRAAAEWRAAYAAYAAALAADPEIVAPARRTIGVDPASYTLAEHFLADDMPAWWDEAQRKDYTTSLAESIQTAVEDWFLARE